MVQRYAHLSPDHIRAAVEQLAVPSKGGTGTRTSTMRHNVMDTPSSKYATI
jgi:hypothetical protein